MVKRSATPTAMRPARAHAVGHGRLDARRTSGTTLHHPIGSANDRHSGSMSTKHMNGKAAAAPERQPRTMLAGHRQIGQCLNEHRMNRRLPKTGQPPYLFAGAGGHHDLHSVIEVDGPSMITLAALDDPSSTTVVLAFRCGVDLHGFLWLKFASTLSAGQHATVPPPRAPCSEPARMGNCFEFAWRERHCMPNHH
jgi:hypothetical protein